MIELLHYYDGEIISVIPFDNEHDMQMFKRGAYCMKGKHNYTQLIDKENIREYASDEVHDHMYRDDAPYLSNYLEACEHFGITESELVEEMYKTQELDQFDIKEYRRKNGG